MMCDSKLHTYVYKSQLHHVNNFTKMHLKIRSRIRKQKITPCERAFNIFFVSCCSLSVVRSLCQDRSSCSHTVAYTLFGGDPCYGTYKYLDVTYSCICECCFVMLGTIQSFRNNLVMKISNLKYAELTGLLELRILKRK